MATLSDHLTQANLLLGKLRGNTDSPERVLVELRKAGCVVSVDGERLVVRGTIAPHLRERIVQFKASIVAVLSGQAALPATSTGEPWDAAAAKALGKILFRRFEANGRTNDPEERLTLARMFDAFDLAYLDQDLGRLKQEAARLTDFFNGHYPRCQQGEVRYGPLPEYQPQFTGWLRLRKKDGWLPIITEVIDRRACSEMLSEYAESYQHCDTIVLPAGEDPNK